MGLTAAFSWGVGNQVLRATSGALWNLSRNPGNRTAFFKAELQTHTRYGLEELREVSPEEYDACKDQ